MRVVREWLHRVVGTVRRRRRDEELEQELRSHLELAAGRFVGAQLFGVAPGGNRCRNFRAARRHGVGSVYSRPPRKPCPSGRGATKRMSTLLRVET
jgi:hypothetical protein